MAIIWISCPNVTLVCDQRPARCGNVNQLKVAVSLLRMSCQRCADGPNGRFGFLFKKARYDFFQLPLGVIVVLALVAGHCENMARTHRGLAVVVDVMAVDNAENLDEKIRISFEKCLGLSRQGWNVFMCVGCQTRSRERLGQ